MVIILGLYDSVKEVAGIIQKADNIELYSKILDVQKEAIDLIEENRKLKNKICELEETMNLKKSVRYIEDAYYIEKEDGTFDGPFCRVCWDTTGKLVRMSKGIYIGGEAACKVCNFIAKTIIKE